jgi:hypothetical protein
MLEKCINLAALSSLPNITSPYLSFSEISHFNLCAEINEWGGTVDIKSKLG